MVEENFEIWLFGTFRIILILLFYVLFHSHLHHGWIKFVIWFSETPENNLIILHWFIVIPSPKMKKILKFDSLKRLRIVLFYFLSESYTFTMVEEHFEIWLLAMPMDSLILLFYFAIIIISPWLKKIMKFDFPKHLRIILFYTVFCMVMPSPWLKKTLKLDFLKRPRIA